MRTGSKFKENTSEGGSALLAVLWIVAILSMMVFTASHFLLAELEAESRSAAIFRAEQLADRGVALASHQQVEKGDPILIQQFGPQEEFSARISSEGSRLNLNALLAKPDTERVVLEDLFREWGLRTDEAIDVVDSLIDWVDPDNVSTGDGAEVSYYLRRDRRNQPFNRAFASLEEVVLVKDFDLVTSVNPDWRSSFTILSSGKLDLNEAPALLIAVTCQCGLENARLFTVSRDGFDQIPGTDDDLVFGSVEEAMAALVPPAEDLSLILERVTVNDPVRHIQAWGRFGDTEVLRIVTLDAAAGSVLQVQTRIAD